ncbi:MAG: SUMF1/EgtB/PvdO family nonheme iron enzyme [Bacteroidia bacterium]
MKLNHNFFYTLLFMLFAQWLSSSLMPAAANNISVSNVRLTDRDVSAGVNNPANFTFIRLNLEWENAWRLNYVVGINNRDAAWLFVKYRIEGGEWQHARLHDSGHDMGSWTGSGSGPAVFEAGLLDPEAAFDNSTNPCLGLFISRSSTGLGSFGAEDMRIRWNYGAQGVTDDDLVEVKVYALEMAFVPQGGFVVGTRGQETGSFTNGSWTSGNTVPLRIGAESAITVAQTVGNLWGRSTVGDSTIGGAATIPAAFPKGYRAFYVMKYEITQEQWIDFFNTLTTDQQANRDITDASGKDSDGLVNRNNVSWSSGFDAELPADEFGDVPCNFLSWADVAAYLDWSGLRPMTELEFEKICRGDRAGQPHEYAWANSQVADAPYSISDAGLPNESISANYNSSDLAGNAHYSLTNGPAGPLRVGIFAANAASTGRITAGAARYGALEMSGNLWERAVTMALPAGRAYTGLHGNGALNTAGNADVSHWPGSDALGAGLRGGGWNSTAAHLRLADRSRAAEANSVRGSDFGGRGVRTIICNVPGDQPAVIDDDEPLTNVLELSTTGAGTGEGYLWVVPSDWQIINGQGSGAINVVVGSLPATVRVSIVNQCGSGPERERTFNP